MHRGRPKKPRMIPCEPAIRQFSPRGRRGRPGYIKIKFEEYEAIRLNDHVGLKQADSARLMGVSQQTFSRVLKSARKYLAEALIRGDVIKITGGDFKVGK